MELVNQYWEIRYGCFITDGLDDGGTADAELSGVFEDTGDY